MRKRIISLLLFLALIFVLAGPTLAASELAADTQTEGEALQSAEENPQDATAGEEETDAAAPQEPETEEEAEPAPPSNFYLNDRPVYGMYLKLIDDVLYCGLRTFFDNALRETQVWWVNNQAEVYGATEAGEALELVACPGACYIVANGRYLYVAQDVRLVDGVTMAPVEVLASVFEESETVWDEESGVARVTLGDRLLTCGEDFYDEDDLELIARVIDQEAGFEPLLGKIALGNLIMNRVASSAFPSTVYDVLYQKSQFTVVKSSKFWKGTPRAESVLAAKLAMDGASILPTALFYNMAGMNSWAARNRPFVATIGHHSFYA